jgi:hypothetical protein
MVTSCPVIKQLRQVSFRAVGNGCKDPEWKWKSGRQLRDDGHLLARQKNIFQQLAVGVLQSVLVADSAAVSPTVTPPVF